MSKKLKGSLFVDFLAVFNSVISDDINKTKAAKTGMVPGEFVDDTPEISKAKYVMAMLKPKSRPAKTNSPGLLASLLLVINSLLFI